DLRTNSILLSGDKTRRLRARTIISHLDTPLEQTGNTQVFYLRYANAKDLVPVLTGVGENIAQQEQGGQQAQSGNGEVSIQADESTNALVVNAPPTLMRDLGAVIRKLDVRRAQVFVEAVIAEVSTDKTKELGVQWAYDGSNSSQPVGVINFGGSGSGLTNLLADPPVIGDGISLALGDTDLAGNGARGAVLLRALAGDADTNVLSTPNLVTMDNEEAEIVVGQNVPFITGSYTSAGGGSTPDNPFQTIERRDVGLTLRVKPQINEGDAVKLEVEQEVSSLTSASTGASDVVTNKRSLKTTVMVDDGQAVVLGGLIDDTLRESIQKVPGLGDLPVVGGLFSYKQTSKVKRNLMVFLRPVILRDAAQSAAVAGEKYSYMRAEQVAVREGGVSLVDKDQVPVMQELEAWMTLPPPFEETMQGREPGAVPPPLNPDEPDR
ncbi:MAG TPA: type II secretion system secretin GspD, partial [Gammaproteobacteria bacterium]|nr:type II secretion system secretin GspD [Gammaproteobacteria bacterium]